MREIKFRAWDKNTKTLRYPDGKKCSESNGALIDWFEDEDLMQYTGLKDKNGREIYEGDILTFTEVDEDSAFGREETHTGEVKWIEEIAQWRFIYPSGQRRELHLITNFEPVYKVEVIGNIYENPELLK